MTAQAFPARPLRLLWPATMTSLICPSFGHWRSAWSAPWTADMKSSRLSILTILRTSDPATTACARYSRKIHGSKNGKTTATTICRCAAIRRTKPDGIHGPREQIKTVPSTPTLQIRSITQEEERTGSSLAELV